MRPSWSFAGCARREEKRVGQGDRQAVPGRLGAVCRIATITKPLTDGFRARSIAFDPPVALGMAAGLGCVMSSRVWQILAAVIFAAFGRVASELKCSLTRP